MRQRVILQGVEQVTNSILYFFIPISIALVDEILGATVYIAINASNYFITIFRSLFFQSLSYFGQRNKRIHKYLLDSAILIYILILGIFLLFAIIFSKQYIILLLVLIAYILSDIARVKLIISSRFKLAIFVNISASILVAMIYSDWSNTAILNMISIEYYFFIVFIPFFMSFAFHMNFSGKVHWKKLRFVPLNFAKHSILNSILFTANISIVYFLLSKDLDSNQMIILFGVYLQLARLASPLQQFLNQVYMFYYAQANAKFKTIKFELYLAIILFICVFLLMLIGVNLAKKLLDFPAEIPGNVLFLLSIDSALITVYIRYSKMLQSIKINYQTSIGMICYTTVFWFYTFISGFELDITQLATGMLLGRITYFLIIMNMFWKKNGQITYS
jgi:hypothetical protein